MADRSLAPGKIGAAFDCSCWHAVLCIGGNEHRRNDLIWTGCSRCKMASNSDQYFQVKGKFLIQQYGSVALTSRWRWSEISPKIRALSGFTMMQRPFHIKSRQFLTVFFSFFADTLTHTRARGQTNAGTKQHLGRSDRLLKTYAWPLSAYGCESWAGL